MTASESAGLTLARVLGGSWRSSPPALEECPNQIEAVSPLLLASGTAALAWRKIHHSGARLTSTIAHKLRENYFQSAISAARHESELARVFAVLRSGGIEPILIKGWSAARLYPESGLRPAGDLDLCLPSAQHAQARSLLRQTRNPPFVTDLNHDEITKFGGFTFDELLDLSQNVPLNGAQVRVLGPEDHLRILCIHLLKHGAWRPLWLCDVAAALESRPADFDWDRCLGRNKRRAQWVVCTIGLARRLLGAEIGDAAIQKRADSPPRWLVTATVRQWDDCRPPMLPCARTQVKRILREPVALLRESRRRLRNPIQATVEADGAFNNLPRLPFQIRDGVRRAVKFLPQLPRSLRE